MIQITRVRLGLPSYTDWSTMYVFVFFMQQKHFLSCLALYGQRREKILSPGFPIWSFTNQHSLLQNLPRIFEFRS